MMEFNSEPFKRRTSAFLIGFAIAMAAPQSFAQQPKNFAIHGTPKPLPSVQFWNGEGRILRIADFRGRVILLNIWATWCGPCREEMPMLDRLQAKMGGPDFEVVALSIDRAGSGVVQKFFAEIGIKHLSLYIDFFGKAANQLKTAGLPTTLLIDRKGREIGRLVGPAEWDTPEMVEFLGRYVSKKSDGQSSRSSIDRAGNLSPPFTSTKLERNTQRSRTPERHFRKSITLRHRPKGAPS